ncbi:alpha-ketoacid dehydrogenase subunit beta [Tengunoibacter tsumagoiensis]|uniref:Pyruvate dehydrogenase E1 component subunit beta n=1 Tax=Tengunoibacter tsumagoiensis TaxID=2014871 RepID=A0A402A9E6_9CHLR|nr:transketolase C-terminal domain-containing protein [Tengunoibacter tsumagoiensis]GCE15797.1 pyruvate dehydrogenase [Tengunoibacter tsumagoiensis]
MTTSERVVEHINQALHRLFADDPHLFLIGEDLLDPYGGAFKVSRGLSTRFPEQILTTPLSEATFMGLASGLALCGEKVIVEIMFGDFITLAYDQLCNFASKSVAMYGRSLAINLVVRCPIGGNRGYGPTHSQSMQKYFMGIPHLHLFEASPFHDYHRLLQRLINRGGPSILFEDKVLYTQRMYNHGLVDDYFIFNEVDSEQNVIRVSLDDGGGNTPDCVFIAPGGLVSRCLGAMRALFLRHEISVELLVPAQLYPFQVQHIATSLQHVEHIFVIEESVAGGTWGCEVAHQIYTQLWGQLKHPIQLIHSKESIIPAAPHLEKQVLVQMEDIYQAVIEAIYTNK